MLAGVTRALANRAARLSVRYGPGSHIVCFPDNPLGEHRAALPQRARQPWNAARAPSADPRARHVYYTGRGGANRRSWGRLRRTWRMRFGYPRVYAFHYWSTTTRSRRA